MQMHSMMLSALRSQQAEPASVSNRQLQPSVPRVLRSLQCMPAAPFSRQRCRLLAAGPPESHQVLKLKGVIFVAALRCQLWLSERVLTEQVVQPRQGGQRQQRLLTPCMHTCADTSAQPHSQ